MSADMAGGSPAGGRGIQEDVRWTAAGAARRRASIARSCSTRCWRPSPAPGRRRRRLHRRLGRPRRRVAAPRRADRPADRPRPRSGQPAAARERLEAVGHPFTLHHANFAGLPAVLAAEGIEARRRVLADLGMSSMQVDDAERGFSYVRDGPLDMRMDRTRGRSAAEVLATISEAELAQRPARPRRRAGGRTVAAADRRRPRGEAAVDATGDLARLLLEAQADGRSRGGCTRRPGKWNLHPAARTFQALRILVNRELANLEQLLRVLPGLLRPGGRAAIISFHSGEDRLVKAAFRDGRRLGRLRRRLARAGPCRAGRAHRNPRSRSAKLRWRRRARSPDP